MAATKIYLDEDVHTFIAQALRLRGWEARTTEEAQRRGADDPEQISFATNNRYAILTYNVKDFPRLHYEIVTRGDTHSGLAAIFSGLVIAVISLVIWDRRTALAPAMRRSQELELREDRLEQVLRTLAQKDPNVADALRQVGLL
jgi:hypothetical protein